MSLAHAGCDCRAELPTACADDNHSGPYFCQKQSRANCLENVQNSLRRRAHFTHDDCALGAWILACDEPGTAIFAARGRFTGLAPGRRPDANPSDASVIVAPPFMRRYDAGTDPRPILAVEGRRPSRWAPTRVRGCGGAMAGAGSASRKSGSPCGGATGRASRARLAIAAASGYMGRVARQSQHEPQS